MGCEREGKDYCRCSYPCSRHGKCCECVRYHRDKGEAPGCFFNEEAEKSYDRSIRNLFRNHR
jgi:hypothetical protein